MLVTVVTGALRQDGDQSLLFTGGSPQETLVLVCVSIRTTHWNILLRTLRMHGNMTAISTVDLHTNMDKYGSGAVWL